MGEDRQLPGDVIELSDDDSDSAPILLLPNPASSTQGYYFSPEGKRLRSKGNVQDYLEKHSAEGSKVERFSFTAPKPWRWPPAAPVHCEPEEPADGATSASQAGLNEMEEVRQLPGDVIVLSDDDSDSEPILLLPNPASSIQGYGARLLSGNPDNFCGF